MPESHKTSGGEVEHVVYTTEGIVLLVFQLGSDEGRWSWKKVNSEGGLTGLTIQLKEH
jgi:hypothetical protein